MDRRRRSVASRQKSGLSTASSSPAQRKAFISGWMTFIFFRPNRWSTKRLPYTTASMSGKLARRSPTRAPTPSGSGCRREDRKIQIQ
jgi:hypothetical protein